MLCSQICNTTYSIMQCFEFFPTLVLLLFPTCSLMKQFTVFNETLLGSVTNTFNHCFCRLTTRQYTI